ncbi:zinc ribbon domain-containing protein [bacterium]|nr:zinc ribbon domain-containing protein [bacterium]
MDNNADLKKSLSMGLEDALKAQLVAGENIIISLPGSFGEAFAVSDKRAFVVRDCDSGLNAECKVFSYPLPDVADITVASSGTSGYIELTLRTPVADAEQARVYFPSYDLGIFQRAVDYINKALSSTQMPQSTPAADISGAVGNKCPKCGVAVEEQSIFCVSCGEQLRQICSQCTSSSPVGSQYCSHCGRKFIAYNPHCPKCGSRIMRWMQYCPECGSMLQKICVACGASIQPDWTHCANCGRLIGSDRLDPRSAMNAQRRLQELRNSESQSSKPAEPPAPEPQQSASQMVAEDYNKRGLKYFENGELEQAVREFKTAVELEPENASYHCNLAVAYDENDDDEPAFAEYSKTLELDPNDLTALLSLGYMYNEHGEHSKAEGVWNKIIAIAPDSAEAQEVRDNLRHQGQL